MKLIGLTGGIGSGKSTVARLLKEQGWTVVDADQIARDIVEPGEPALTELAEAFGADIIREDGSL
ncbi:TPA: dephospho-CoA kinase, partial [Staphylococcus aureus]|nr:dephospho-CoA kinase [Staphylococcus aureus]